jgi:pyruvate formate lyase activating enzyme
MQSKHEEADNAMVNAKGMVFDIQRYSIHDGPGIRTMIFLKGCPLQCLWCCNPESWLPESQLFYSKSKCILCGSCIQKAPVGTISVNAEELDINFPTLNSKDLSWTKDCPTGALSIKGKWMTVDEIFSIIMKDEIYYRTSGGGITLSGGEPLMQATFSHALLEEACRNNISTAIETSGYIKTETLLSVIPLTDLFLYDFKLFDDNEHRRYTGVGNKTIKANLEMLAGKGAEILVRMPLIPEVNDDEDHLRQTMDYLLSIGIQRFTILPYHQYGIAKFKSIGSTYTFPPVNPLEEDAIEKIKLKIADAFH